VEHFIPLSLVSQALCTNHKTRNIFKFNQTFCENLMYFTMIKGESSLKTFLKDFHYWIRGDEFLDIPYVKKIAKDVSCWCDRKWGYDGGGGGWEKSKNKVLNEPYFSYE
jgi:hypothetical protein